jgi:hypothetical protein
MGRAAMLGTRIMCGSRTGSILLVFGLLVGALSFLPSPAAAATMSVDCAADPSALQPAIDAAEPGDIVNVTGTCLGNFTIDKDLILQGTGTLDGNHEGPVLRIAGGRVTVADLTITNGVASDNFCFFARGGGGIYNSGTLTLNSARVNGNSGGGIYNDCFSNLILNGSTTVSGNSGFGIDLDYLSSVTLNDAASVSNNTNGGINVAHDGYVEMNDSSSVTGNTGSGIYDNGGVSMNGFSSVSGNITTHAGGGIFVALHQYLVMNDSASISGNVANEGGGISADWVTVAVLNDSASVWGNSATRGGGISSFSIPEFCNEVILNDSASVHDNIATQTGGGIATSSCNVTLNNSASVTGNVAGTKLITGRGGGIWDSGVVIALNAASRIQGNKARGPGGDGGGIYLCPGVFGDGVLIQNGGVVKNNKPNDIKFDSTCSF